MQDKLPNNEFSHADIRMVDVAPLRSIPLILVTLRGGQIILQVFPACKMPL